MLAPAAQAVVAEPPDLPFAITIFPERDFVNVAWDGADKALTFDLVRDGVTIGHAESDQADPLPDIMTETDPDSGEHLLEVNHPGGLCWVGSTPDILPGDRLTIRETGDDPGNGIAATTLNITAEPAEVEPVTDNVVIHGTALNADDSPMDLAMIEQRIISAGNLFEVNSKRDIRATSDGESLGLITEDPDVDGGWIATYTGLSEGDRARVLAGETRGMAWQDTNAAGDRLGITIFEAGLTGGPGMPECPDGAVNSVAAASPRTVNAANVAGGLTLSGSSFNASSVTVTLDDADPGTEAVTASGTPSSATDASSYTVSFTGAQVAGLADGSLSATSSFEVPGGPISGSGMSVLKDTVVPLPPTTDTAPGSYALAQSVRLSRAAGEDSSSVVHYTTDGTVPGASSPSVQPILVTSSRTIRAVVVDAAGNVSDSTCPAACFGYSITGPTVPPVAAPPANRPGAGTAAIIPLSPRIGEATSGKPGGADTATARWTAPVANGAVRDGYQVRALKLRPGRAAKIRPAVVVGPNATKLKLTLPAGTYKFQVRATSAAGDSPWSARSARVTAR